MKRWLWLPVIGILAIATLAMTQDTWSRYLPKVNPNDYPQQSAPGDPPTVQVTQPRQPDSEKKDKEMSVKVTKVYYDSDIPDFLYIEGIAWNSGKEDLYATYILVDACEMGAEKDKKDGFRSVSGGCPQSRIMKAGDTAYRWVGMCRVPGHPQKVSIFIAKLADSTYDLRVLTEITTPLQAVEVHQTTVEIP